MERPLLYYATKLLKDESQAFDVLQEVRITVLRAIRKLQHPKSLRPWLYRITYGRAIDRMRQDTSRQRLQEAQTELFSELDQSSTFDRADAAAVHRALDEVDMKFREVLILRFLEISRSRKLHRLSAARKGRSSHAFITRPRP